MVIALLIALPNMTKNCNCEKNTLPVHLGDNQKIVALHLSPSCHPPSYPVGGGGWVGAVVTDD